MVYHCFDVNVVPHGSHANSTGNWQTLSMTTLGGLYVKLSAGMILEKKIYFSNNFPSIYFPYAKHNTICQVLLMLVLREKYRDRVIGTIKLKAYNHGTEL
jgi:hypothetical protein